MKVSVLLLTFNEEVNLPRCLDALAFCDDVVAVDSGSSDATLAICEVRGVRVLSRPFDTFAGQRNFGLDNAVFRNEWVLHLDADEVVTPEFQVALDALVPPPGVLGWRVPSKLMLYGRWLRRAGMYPTYQVRLGHRDDMRFVQVGHGQREALPPEKVATFPEHYLHYNFSQGLPAWLRKHVRYAEDEAAERFATPSGPRPSFAAALRAGRTERRRMLKELAGGLPPIMRPLLRFFYVYLWRGGILEGRAGLLYAVMLSTYEAMIAINLIGAALTRTDRCHGGDGRP